MKFGKLGTVAPGALTSSSADANALIRILPSASAQNTFGETTYAAFLQNAGFLCGGDSQGLHPGLVCDAPSGHGIGHVVGGSGIGNTMGVRYRTRGRGPRDRKRVGRPVNGHAVAGPVSGTRWAHGIETVIVQYALNGHRIPAQGIALGTASHRIGVF